MPASGQNNTSQIGLRRLRRTVKLAKAKSRPTANEGIIQASPQRHPGTTHLLEQLPNQSFIKVCFNVPALRE